jgi:pimeloyl-ACP methyl ester carboxylesterase
MTNPFCRDHISPRSLFMRAMETLRVPLGGLNFTVDIAGPQNGPPVLLLHGFPETRHMWRHQLSSLAEAGFHAMAPDQRGYSEGARPQETEAYATDLLVGDALSLMDALGARPFHLVGHDWGGQIAWLIAAQKPERVRSLFVLSRPHPAAFARAMQEDKAQAERSRHHRSFRDSDAIARMRAARLEPLRKAMMDQGVPAEDAEDYVGSLLAPGAIEGAMSWYRASNIAAASTPAVTVPTTYVWGSADATVGRRAAELTRDYVRGAFRFDILDGAGHFLVDEFPTRISALLLEHLIAYA